MRLGEIKDQERHQVYWLFYRALLQNRALLQKSPIKEPIYLTGVM